MDHNELESKRCPNCEVNQISGDSPCSVCGFTFQTVDVGNDKPFNENIPVADTADRLNKGLVLITSIMGFVIILLAIAILVLLLKTNNKPVRQGQNYLTSTKESVKPVTLKNDNIKVHDDIRKNEIKTKIKTEQGGPLNLAEGKTGHCDAKKKLIRKTEPVFVTLAKKAAVKNKPDDKLKNGIRLPWPGAQIKCNRKAVVVLSESLDKIAFIDIELNRVVATLQCREPVDKIFIYNDFCIGVSLVLEKTFFFSITERRLLGSKSFPYNGWSLRDKDDALGGLKKAQAIPFIVGGNIRLPLSSISNEYLPDWEILHPYRYLQRGEQLFYILNPENCAAYSKLPLFHDPLKIHYYTIKKKKGVALKIKVNNDSDIIRLRDDYEHNLPYDLNIDAALFAWLSPGSKYVHLERLKLPPFMKKMTDSRFFINDTYVWRENVILNCSEKIDSRDFCLEGGGNKFKLSDKKLCVSNAKPELHSHYLHAAIKYQGKWREIKQYIFMLLPASFEYFRRVQKDVLFCVPREVMCNDDGLPFAYYDNSCIYFWDPERNVWQKKGYKTRLAPYRYNKYYVVHTEHCIFLLDDKTCKVRFFKELLRARSSFVFKDRIYLLSGDGVYSVLKIKNNMLLKGKWHPIKVKAKGLQKDDLRYLCPAYKVSNSSERLKKMVFFNPEKGVPYYFDGKVLSSCLANILKATDKKRAFILGLNEQLILVGRDSLNVYNLTRGTRIKEMVNSFNLPQRHFLYSGCYPFLAAYKQGYVVLSVGKRESIKVEYMSAANMKKKTLYEFAGGHPAAVEIIDDKLVISFNRPERSPIILELPPKSKTKKDLL